MIVRLHFVVVGVLSLCGLVSAQPPIPPSAIPPTPPTAMPKNPAPMPDKAKESDPKTADKPEKFEWPSRIDNKTLEDWIKDLDPRVNRDPTLREVAVKIIPGFGPAAQKAVPALTQSIRDPDPGVRIAAMVVLTGMSLEDELEVRRVSEAMAFVIAKTPKGSAERLHAARSLTALGPAAHWAIGSVIRLTDDPWWETRQAAAGALGRIGAATFHDKDKDVGPEAIIAPKREADKVAMKKLLYVSLQDESATVRMEATQALLTLGPPYNADPLGYKREAQPLIDIVHQRIRTEKDRNILVWLHLILMMYDDREFDTGIPSLAEFIQDPKPSVRVQALMALEVLGPKAEPALEAIIRALHQEDEIVTLAAVACLASMKDKANGALTPLVALKAESKDEPMEKIIDQAIESIKNPKQAKPVVVNPDAQR